MLTWQDYEAIRTDADRLAFIRKLIAEHCAGEMYRTAQTADEYDARRNTTITELRKKLYAADGHAVPDTISSTSRIASGFFRRLNTQRCAYLLGNGATFTRTKIRTDENGDEVRVDLTREQLGRDFDTALYRTAYKALIHGVCFGLWDEDGLTPYPVTEFAPLWDEETGALRAGARFWRLSGDKPMTVVWYEADGYTRLRSNDAGDDLRVVQDKRAYMVTAYRAPADAEPVAVEAHNYNGLPIVPLWGSSLHQSTLVGMQEAIDSYDLIRSGFADDLRDCAQIYWMLENYGGMRDEDLAQFRDRMLLQHMAVADTSQGGKVQAYTQEIPHQARQVFLDQMRQGIYEDFGALDVKSISAAAKTATEIDAAYQPLDEEADDLELQVIEFVRGILALIGIDDVPVFKRNRISNQLEQVQTVMLEAPYLDDETILNKLPNISPDEVQKILAAKNGDDAARFARDRSNPPEDGEGETGDGDA